nr:hypothetical protein [Methylobacterium sp. WL120]
MIGLDFYTFISQIETGRGRIPPGQLPDLGGGFTS